MGALLQLRKSKLSLVKRSKVQRKQESYILSKQTIQQKEKREDGKKDM